MYNYKKYLFIYNVYYQTLFFDYDFCDELVRANTAIEAEARILKKFGNAINILEVKKVDSKYAKKFYDKGVYRPQLYKPRALEKKGFIGPLRPPFA